MRSGVMPERGGMGDIDGDTWHVRATVPPVRTSETDRAWSAQEPPVSQPKQRVAWPDGVLARSRALFAHRRSGGIAGSRPGSAADGPEFGLTFS
jgi:hypothetical protein